jgi:hypothetical protein
MWLAGDLSEAMQPNLSGVIVERLPSLQTSVLALTANADDSIPQEIVDFYNAQGRAVVARGQRVYLPAGMTHNDVRVDLIRVATEMEV